MKNKEKENLKFKIYLDKILNNKFIDKLFNGIYFFHKSGILRQTEHSLLKIAMYFSFLFGIYLSVGSALTKVIEHKSPLSFIVSQINPIFQDKIIDKFFSIVMIYLIFECVLTIIINYKIRTLKEE